jgi:hypothetical protein
MKTLNFIRVTTILLLLQSSIFYGQNFPIVGFGDAANYTIGYYTVPGSSGLDLHWYGGIRFGDWTSNSVMQITNGNVGIGMITNPSSKLSVNGTISSYEPTALGATFNSSQMINIMGGNVGDNTIMNKLWTYRDSSSNNWYSARLHDGISVDSSFNTPHTDTKTWWERDPLDNIQSWGNDAQTYLTINKGNVGIGTIAPDEKLTVKGKIHTQEVRVDMSGPLVPDYVFAEDYKLKSLSEIENYIKQNKHLPEIPSAGEIEKNGLMLAEMNMNLLKKIEELTLYIIQQEKKNSIQTLEIENSKNEIEILKKQNESLKSILERLTQIEEKLK